MSNLSIVLIPIAAISVFIYYIYIMKKWVSGKIFQRLFYTPYNQSKNNIGGKKKYKPPINYCKQHRNSRAYIKLIFEKRKY